MRSGRRKSFPAGSIFSAAERASGSAVLDQAVIAMSWSRSAALTADSLAGSATLDSIAMCPDLSEATRASAAALGKS
jgi:hypothetical protein